MIVGFAAETDDVLANGRTKLRRKGCDLLVVNEVGERKTFGSEENEAVVLGADGSETPVPHGPKEFLAETVWTGWAHLLTRMFPSLLGHHKPLPQWRGAPGQARSSLGTMPVPQVTALPSGETGEPVAEHDR